MHSQRNIRNAKAIEMMLQGKRNKLPFERMNDIDERYTTIYGGSVWLVEFDDSIRTPTTIGDVKVTCLAPDHFFGQENVFEVEDMEYCFLRFPTTKDEIVRKYGVDESVAEEAENEEAIEGEATVDGDEYTATVVVCYYKDEDDLVCEYVFSGDVCLLDVSDYYARKRKVCAVCGQREGICACEKPEYEEMSADEEEITHNIKLSDGSVLGPVSQVIVDGVPQTQMVSQVVKSPTGEMVFDDSQGFYAPALEMVEQPVTEPTVIPYYRPKRLPVVIRKNISQENSVFGQSDCAAIREQQQLINKIETRIAEKLLKAGVYAIVPNDYEGDLTAGILNQVLRSDASNYNQFGRIDMQPNTALDISEAERLYDHAKRILGISDSLTGSESYTEKSGVAVQLNITRSISRLESKRRLKYSAYSELYHIIACYYLAFYDGEMELSFRDAEGCVHNSVFRKSDFVEGTPEDGYHLCLNYVFGVDLNLGGEYTKESLWGKISRI
jgi:hypothetical protein